MKKTKRTTTIDDLAVMVAKGFEGVNEQFKNVNEQFKGVQEQFKGVNEQFKGVNGRLDELEKGQEEIILKLDNVAYRFELVELQRRVDLLEKKVGMRR